MKHLPEIDFLRGFAIMTIVVMHYLSILNLPDIILQMAKFGGAGVHLFILCSGFGLYLSYLNKPCNYLEFLRQRFNRLYLKYAILIVLYVFMGLHINKPFTFNEVASHIFLYKMFCSQLNTSICYYYWFISTIFQCYLCWPLLLKLFKLKYGICISFIISLGWALLVGILGYEHKMAWSNCCLQYLWEMILGMYLAKYYYEKQILPMPSNIWLILGVVIGVPLTALMGWQNNFFKLFNDIPSLLGYTSVALVIYKIKIPFFNQFMAFTCKIGYEWYLVHGIIAHLVTFHLSQKLPALVLFAMCFVISYTIAWIYNKLYTAISNKICLKTIVSKRQKN